MSTPNENLKQEIIEAVEAKNGKKLDKEESKIFSEKVEDILSIYNSSGQKINNSNKNEVIQECIDEYNLHADVKICIDEVSHEVKDVIEEKGELTKEKLFEIMWNYEGRGIQESYDYFINLNSKFKTLRITGKGIKKLKTLSEINIEGNIQTFSVFQEWINKIFINKEIQFKEKIKKIEKIDYNELFKNLSINNFKNDLNIFIENNGKLTTFSNLYEKIIIIGNQKFNLQTFIKNFSKYFGYQTRSSVMCNILNDVADGNITNYNEVKKRISDIKSKEKNKIKREIVDYNEFFNNLDIDILKGDLNIFLRDENKKIISRDRDSISKTITVGHQEFRLETFIKNFSQYFGYKTNAISAIYNILNDIANGGIMNYDEVKEKIRYIKNTQKKNKKENINYNELFKNLSINNFKNDLNIFIENNGKLTTFSNLYEKIIIIGNQKFNLQTFIKNFSKYFGYQTRSSVMCNILNDVADGNITNYNEVKKRISDIKSKEKNKIKREIVDYNEFFNNLDIDILKGDLSAFLKKESKKKINLSTEVILKKIIIGNQEFYLRTFIKNFSQYFGYKTNALLEICNILNDIVDGNITNYDEIREKINQIILKKKEKINLSELLKNLEINSLKNELNTFLKKENKNKISKTKNLMSKKIIIGKYEFRLETFIKNISHFFGYKTVSGAMCNILNDVANGIINTEEKLKEHILSLNKNPEILVDELLDKFLNNNGNSLTIDELEALGTSKLIKARTLMDSKYAKTSVTKDLALLIETKIEKLKSNKHTSGVKHKGNGTNNKPNFINSFTNKYFDSHISKVQFSAILKYSEIIKNFTDSKIVAGLFRKDIAKMFYQANINGNNTETFFKDLEKITKIDELKDVIKKEKELYLSVSNKKIDNIKSIPKEYQNISISKIINSSENHILADEQGLGKTFQTICCMQDYINKTGKNALIVCPKSVITEWENEFEKHLEDNSGVYILKSGRKINLDKIKKAKYIIVNYEFLRANGVQSNPGLVEHLNNIGYLAIDESHRLSNAETKTFDVISKIKYDKKLGLTGSIYSNNSKQLAHIINMMGWNDEFCEIFGLDSGLITESIISKLLSDDKTIGLLHEFLFESKIIRRTKDIIYKKKVNDGIKGIPGVKTSNIDFQFTSEQFELLNELLNNPGSFKEKYKSIYNSDFKQDAKNIEKTEKLLEENYSESLNESIKAKGISQLELEMLLDFISIFPNKFNSQFKESPIFKKLDDIILEKIASNKKTILFARNKKVISVLEERYKDIGETFRYDGTKKELKEFKEHNGGGILIANTTSAGEGLNIPEADSVIFVQQPYTYREYSQALARIVRLDSIFKEVEVINLLSNTQYSQTKHEKIIFQKIIFELITSGVGDIEKIEKENYSIEAIKNYQKNIIEQNISVSKGINSENIANKIFNILEKSEDIYSKFRLINFLEISSKLDNFSTFINLLNDSKDLINTFKMLDNILKIYDGEFLNSIISDKIIQDLSKINNMVYINKFIELSKKDFYDEDKFINLQEIPKNILWTLVKLFLKEDGTFRTGKSSQVNYFEDFLFILKDLEEDNNSNLEKLNKIFLYNSEESFKPFDALQKDSIFREFAMLSVESPQKFLEELHLIKRVYSLVKNNDFLSKKFYSISRLKEYNYMLEELDENGDYNLKKKFKNYSEYHGYRIDIDGMIKLLSNNLTSTYFQKEVYPDNISEYFFKSNGLIDSLSEKEKKSFSNWFSETLKNKSYVGGTDFIKENQSAIKSKYEIATNHELEGAMFNSVYELIMSQYFEEIFKKVNDNIEEIKVYKGSYFDDIDGTDFICKIKEKENNEYKYILLDLKSTYKNNLEQIKGKFNLPKEYSNAFGEKNNSCNKYIIYLKKEQLFKNLGIALENIFNNKFYKHKFRITNDFKKMFNEIK